MICSTIRRTLSILTACSLLAAPAVLFTGCGSSNDNAASFLELNGKTRELVEMLDGEQVDKNAAEAKIGEISALLEKLPSGTGFLSYYKSNVNSFIGQVREYTSGSPDPKKFNNVIEEFNRLSSTSSNVDVNALDAKK